MKKANMLDVIGPKTSVTFRPQGVLDVPAKVDTGADSSSIWASDIKEKDGVLTFVLFDPQSPWYNGRKIKTKQYSLRSIKNSFGVTEFRYKVPLNVEFGGKKIRARFTLSDRSNNRYPVLIGRRTLKNRFVVDVSQEDFEKLPRVLMLVNRTMPSTERFSQNLNGHGKVSIEYAAYEDLFYETGEMRNSIKLLKTGEDIASFDMVFFKTTARHLDLAASAARYLQKRGVKFMDPAAVNYPASSKLYQYIIASDNHIRIPKSVFLLPAKLPENYKLISQKLGLPFVLKDIHGNKGEHNYLIRDEKSFKKACKRALKANVWCVAQGFIENDGDYRVLVFGKRIPLVIERVRNNDKTHLNNPSQGARSKLVKTSELPTKVQKDCIISAEIMNRDVAGVDMVKDKKSGMWYCLEINDGPQLASGSFVTEKHTAFSEYLNQELRK